MGVALGILSYIHTSDDTAVDMLDRSDEYDRYGREQRKLDRKQHGSNDREKQRQKAATTKRHLE